VKGPKNLGVRLGNWLTADQARALWQAPDPNTLKGKRDRALLGILLGCGLRRKEATQLCLCGYEQISAIDGMYRGSTQSCADWHDVVQSGVL
jgi:site-specific recombinase XerD